MKPIKQNNRHADISIEKKIISDVGGKLEEYVIHDKDGIVRRLLR